MGTGFYSRHLVTWLWKEAPPEALSLLSEGFLRSAGMSALSMVVCAAAIFFISAHERLAPVLLSVCFVQYFMADEPLYQLTRPQVLNEPTGLVQDILTAEGPPALGRFRIFGGVDAFNTLEAPDMTAVDFTAISSSVGMDAVTPALWDIEGANAYLPGSTVRVHSLSDHSANYFLRMLPVLNTRYATLSRWFFERLHGAPGLVIDEQRQLGVLLLRNPETRPRAYLSRAHCVKTFDEAWSLVSSKDFKLEEETAVECPRPLATSVEGASGTVRIVSDAPERVELEVDAPAPTLVVLADAFYAGWKVEVDGHAADILPANVAVRGVPVSAGRHQMVFVYRTPGLVAGAVVSGVSWGLAALIAVVPLGRRRRGPKAPPGTTAPSAAV
jgi:hypothetical protein